MRRNGDDFCERPRCRRECTLTYLGTRRCGQQDGDERATESQAPCPGCLDLPLMTCVSAQVQQAAVRNSSDSTDCGSLRPFGGWRSKSKIVNATGLSGAFFESSEALCGLGEHSP